MSWGGGAGVKKTSQRAQDPAGFGVGPEEGSHLQPKTPGGQPVNARARGLTLIESLVLLVILAVVLSVLLPALG